MSLSIIIGGDIVPSSVDCSLSSEGQPRIIDPDVVRLLQDSDFRVFNLESPIGESEKTIKKEGRCFIAHPDCVDFLKSLGCTALGIANNHIKDYGEAGMLQTLDILNQNEITPFGYGENYKNASDTVILKKDGKSVAIIACSETEFTTFLDGGIGAVPYHDYWTNRKITEAKKNCDIVVVLYHGGKEYYPYAAPYHQERCHIMVDAGADFILSQHSHCIGGLEEYCGAKILYGQGNFIFDQKNGKAETKQGLLARIVVENTTNLELIPVMLEDGIVKLADEETKKQIADDFKKRAEVLGSDDLLLKEYEAFAKKNLDQYLARCEGDNGIVRFVYKVINKLKVKAHSEKNLITIKNILQNEAHRNLFLTGISVTLDKGDRND